MQTGGKRGGHEGRDRVGLSGREGAECRYVVFTDLDGTLVDHSTYAWEKSLPGLELVQRGGVPLIFCSSKTRAEQEYYRQEIGIKDPYIVENGGAVCIPEGYFGFEPEGCQHLNGLWVLEFGRSYDEIRMALDEVRRSDFEEIRGYADVSVTTLMALLGLDSAAVERARCRDYEETIVTPLTPERLEAFRAALAGHGLTLNAGGRFHSVSAGNDKGRAVRVLTELYRRQWPELLTVGIGDSWNDASMFKAVDRAFLVQRPGGEWEAVDVEHVEHVAEVGPRGWTQVIRKLVGEH